MQTDQPIFPSAIIKGQLKMNEGRRGDLVAFCFDTGLLFLFLGLGVGGGTEGKCPSPLVLPCLHSELDRDLDPASAGSPVPGGLQRVSYTTSFSSLLICPSVKFPLKRNALKTPSHCSSKLFKACELSYHMLNHFSYGKTLLQAPAKRLTFIVAIQNKL